MASVPISELEPLEEGAVSIADELVLVDISASATKKVEAKALVSDVLKQLPPSSIPGNIFIAPEVIGSIGTEALADNSVTAEKLADASSGKFLNSLDGINSEGAFVGQIGSFNSTGYMWNGVRWSPIGSVATITGSSNIVLTTTVNSFAGETDIETTFTRNSNFAGQYLGYDNQGNVVPQNISIGDLQVATSTLFGVVRIPDGDGLKVINGDVSIDNNIAAAAIGMRAIEYNSKGLITQSRDYAEGDLPYASATNSGVVKIGAGLTVLPGGTIQVDTGNLETNVPIATSVSPGIVMPQGGLVVEANGALSTDPNPIDPNGQSATKISWDSNGLVTSGTFLEAGDIPPLDFNQIVTGVLNGGFINDGTIPRRALSDFCITFVQEGEPSLDIAYSIGTFWYKESTRILRIFTGTRWAQVGSGGGSGGSTATLEWAGFIDATTGLITQTTSIGQNNGGFVIGQGLPAASDELTGYYCIVTVPGAGIPETPDDTYTENDWVICLGAEEGWQFLSQSAGGGGGAANLSDLLDCQIDLPNDGHVLNFNATAGKWQNSIFLSGQLNGTKIQHKYSTQLLADPLIGDLEPGELWLNIHSGSPTLYLRTYDELNGTERLSQWTSDDQLLRVQTLDFIEPMYNATDPDFNPSASPTVAIRPATQEGPGYMSALDKIKLDSIDPAAVDGVQSLTADSPVVLTDQDNPAEGKNLAISVNTVTNTTNGLMLATDKIILDGLAQATQVQSDFAVTDTSAAAYIKNKPQNATSDADGYMSSVDKQKLDNIAENANAGIPEAPNDGQQYVRRNQAWAVLTQAPAGAQVVINTIPPGGSQPGDLWLDSNTGELHVYYDDGDSQQWLNTSTAGGGIWTEGVAKPPQMGGNPPIDARPGDFWLDARSGILYIYYADGDSEQWIACSSGSGGGDVNGNIPIGADPPQNPVYGDTWIDPDTLALYVYFNDGGSDQWAQVSTTTAGSGGPAFTEDPPSDPRTGDLWIRPSTLKQYVYTGSAWASVICC